MRMIYRNAAVTFISQILTLLFKFALQCVFIKTLGVEYLGYNAVFSNILQMLNMADLGIGIAVTSYLYKPISENDYDRINALMKIYKILYAYIGAAVSIIGIVILVFLPAIIPDAKCSGNFLRVLFFINLSGTVSTYFLAYKRTLTIAQQKAYFTNAVDMIINVVCVVLQIVTLIIWSNYFIFLILNVAKNIISNIIITVDCSRKNKYLKREPSSDLMKEYKGSVIAYVKDVFISKIGGYVYYGTDNIIISIFLGSIFAGYLSNYSLVSTALQTIVTQVFTAQQATYGNYVAIANNNNDERILTDNYFFVNYIVANICMVCCMFMFQPFTSLFYGTAYLLSNYVVILLSINLALTIILIIPSQVFIIYKMYHYDKPIIVISALINIFLSIVLVRFIGVVGTLIGTTVTSLIYLFSRLYIIAKLVFRVRFCYYLIKIVKYAIATTLSVLVSWIASSFIKASSWLDLLLLAVVLCTISVVLPIIALFNTREAKYLINKVIIRKS